MTENEPVATSKHSMETTGTDSPPNVVWSLIALYLVAAASVVAMLLIF